MNRYKELLSLAKAEKPANIIEIGTWNGVRAVELVKSTGAKYIGFDLFEEASAKTDYEEKNVKAHFSQSSVYNYFFKHNIAGKLIKGNTNDTLPKFREEFPEILFDFAWIDGGHAVDTIKNDWHYVEQMMAPGALIVFDDYYVNFNNTNDWGCNSIVDSLDYKQFGESLDPVKSDGINTQTKVKIAWTRKLL